jgi:hypothetical protein
VRAAHVASLTGDFAQARSWLDEADALFGELGDVHGSVAAIGERCEVEGRTGNYDEAVELAERLAELRRSLDDAEPEAAAPKARTPSEAESLLAWALLGRALEGGDVPRQNVVGRSLREEQTPRPPRGRRWNKRFGCTILQSACSCSEPHSESIATGQRALGLIRELEATLETEIAMVWDCLFTIGVSQCGRGDDGSGISLVATARRLYHVSGVGVAEEPFAQAVLGRAEKSARTALGDDGYEAAVNAGEALTRDEAIALGLSIAPD